MDLIRQNRAWQEGKKNLIPVVLFIYFFHLFLLVVLISTKNYSTPGLFSHLSQQFHFWLKPLS